MSKLQPLKEGPYQLLCLADKKGSLVSVHRGRLHFTDEDPKIARSIPHDVDAWLVLQDVDDDDEDSWLQVRLPYAQNSQENKQIAKRLNKTFPGEMMTGYDDRMKDFDVFTWSTQEAQMVMDQECRIHEDADEYYLDLFIARVWQEYLHVIKDV